MTALDIACRHQDPSGTTCGAQAGDKCLGILESGRTVVLTFYHSERIEDANAISRSADTPTVEQFDKAVEGLI